MPALIVEAPSDDEEPQACTDCLVGTKYPVHRAASLGHVDCLTIILDKLESADMLLDAENNTPMHAACAAGQIDSLKYLVENTRIPLRAKNDNGSTCCHLAAERGKLDILKALLGGNSLQRAQLLAFEKDTLGCTLLHCAVLSNDNDVAIWLLQRFGKAIANIANDDAVVPLHVAAAQGNIEFIRVVTRFDMHVANKRDRNGGTAAFYAVQGGYLQCLKYLVDKARADVHSVTKRGQSLLHAACLNGHVLIVQWLLGKMDKSATLQQTLDGASSFHFASFSGHFGILKLLYKASGSKKYATSSTDQNGNTPLHLATLNGHLYCVKFLLDLGADPKAKNKAAHTAVDIAEQKSYTQITALFLSYLHGSKHYKKFKKNAEIYGPIQFPDFRGVHQRTLSISGYSTTASVDGYVQLPFPIPGANFARMPNESIYTHSSGYASSTENMPLPFSRLPDPPYASEDSLLISKDNWLLKRRLNHPFELTSDQQDAISAYYERRKSKASSHTSEGPTPLIERQSIGMASSLTNVSMDIPSSPSPVSAAAMLRRHGALYKSTPNLHTNAHGSGTWNSAEGPGPSKGAGPVDVIIRRRFLDAHTQTDLDFLDSDILVVDDQERVIYSSTSDVPSLYGGHSSVYGVPPVVMRTPKSPTLSQHKSTQVPQGGDDRKKRRRKRRSKERSKTQAVTAGFLTKVREATSTSDTEVDSAKIKRRSQPEKEDSIYTVIRSSSEEAPPQSMQTLASNTSEREAKYALIAATEQIDMVLDADRESVASDASSATLRGPAKKTTENRSILYAIAMVHNSSVTDSESNISVKDDENGSATSLRQQDVGPPLVLPIYHNPENSQVDRIQSFKSVVSNRSISLSDVSTMDDGTFSLTPAASQLLPTVAEEHTERGETTSLASIGTLDVGGPSRSRLQSHSMDDLSGISEQGQQHHFNMNFRAIAAAAATGQQEPDVGRMSWAQQQKEQLWKRPIRQQIPQEDDMPPPPPPLPSITAHTVQQSVPVAPTTKEFGVIDVGRRHVSVRERIERKLEHQRSLSPHRTLLTDAAINDDSINEPPSSHPHESINFSNSHPLLEAAPAFQNGLPQDELALCGSKVSQLRRQFEQPDDFRPLAVVAQRQPLYAKKQRPTSMYRQQQQARYFGQANASLLDLRAKSVSLTDLMLVPDSGQLQNGSGYKSDNEWVSSTDLMMEEIARVRASDRLDKTNFGHAPNHSDGRIYHV